ncbi:hypothetical protein HPP92_020946 [Vanilla planifolia]|uniref:Uncharacterized protein n=1 Tax=Vanilla planifolia TaxID=51239 RepID=A0A835PWA8_VANPL|nr:hypothetical protein HPP92_021266 [Vanilla planifolia]KAG0462470.1 hypothetical protein HPP92_020946 [Vanilla planifolia]
MQQQPAAPQQRATHRGQQGEPELLQIAPSKEIGHPRSKITSSTITTQWGNQHSQITAGGLARKRNNRKARPAVETLAEGSRRLTGGQKRKVGSSHFSTASAPFPITAPVSSSPAPLKRLVKERNANVLPIVGHNGPWTRARQTPNKYAAPGPQNSGCSRRG